MLTLFSTRNGTHNHPFNKFPMMALFSESRLEQIYITHARTPLPPLHMKLQRCWRNHFTLILLMDKKIIIVKTMVDNDSALMIVQRYIQARIDNDLLFYIHGTIMSSNWGT